MRPDNTAPIIAAARQRHELARAKAIQAIRELDRADTAITFTGVAGTAGFSELGSYVLNCHVRAYLCPPASLMAVMTRQRLAWSSPVME